VRSADDSERLFTRLDAERTGVDFENTSPTGSLARKSSVEKWGPQTDSRSGTETIL